jgi:hypothetical protein
MSPVSYSPASVYPLIRSNIIEVWEISFPDGPVRRRVYLLLGYFSTSTRRRVQIGYSPRTHSPDRPEPILNSALLRDGLRRAAGGDFLSQWINIQSLQLNSIYLRPIADS